MERATQQFPEMLPDVLKDIETSKIGEQEKTEEREKATNAQCGNIVSTRWNICLCSIYVVML